MFLYDQVCSLNLDLLATKGERGTKPIGDVIEEIVSSEVPNLDLNQPALATINCVAANLLQLVTATSHVSHVAHVNLTPRQGVFTDSTPRSAHFLRAFQFLDHAETVQDR